MARGRRALAVAAAVVCASAVLGSGGRHASVAAAHSHSSASEFGPLAGRLCRGPGLLDYLCRRREDHLGPARGCGTPGVRLGLDGKEKEGEKEEQMMFAKRWFVLSKKKTSERQTERESANDTAVVSRARPAFCLQRERISIACVEHGCFEALLTGVVKLVGKRWLLNSVERGMADRMPRKRFHHGSFRAPTEKKKKKTEKNSTPSFPSFFFLTGLPRARLGERAPTVRLRPRGLRRQP